MRAWVVRFFINGEECLEAFTDGGKAVAFFDSCGPEHKATIHRLEEVADKVES